MKPSLAFKLVLMTAMLVGVIYTIRMMNAQTMGKAFDALGLQAGGAGSPGLQAAGTALKAGEERFNLCRTRITAIEFGTGRKIFESTAGLKTTWLASEPIVGGQQGTKQDPAPSSPPREIGTLDIEKWLTQHCQVVVQAIAREAVASFNSESTIELKYVDGTSLRIVRFDGHYFEIENHYFDSVDFAAALTEIQMLAQMNPASGL